MTSEDVLDEFKQAGALLEGHFILSSGLHSERYLQCARVLMDPVRAERLCSTLVQKLGEFWPNQKFDLVVSPAMGGVVVGYEMGRQLGVPSIFTERVDGEFTLRRGFSIEPGQSVLMVEDVVTTGKSSRECIATIVREGGIVTGACSLVDRSSGGVDLGVPYLSLLTLDVPTFGPGDIPEHLRSVPAVKPGSRDLHQKK